MLTKLLHLVPEYLRSELNFYRALAATSGVLIPAFWIFRPEEGYDPLWQRFVLALVGLSFVILTYISPWARKNMRPLVHGILFLFLAWISNILYQNQGSTNYTMIYAGFLFSAALIIHKSSWLLAFSILNVGIVAGLNFLDPPVQAYNTSLFTGLIAFLLFLINIAQVYRRNLQKSLNEQTKLMAATFELAPEALLVVVPETMKLEYHNQLAVSLLVLDKSKHSDHLSLDRAFSEWLPNSVLTKIGSSLRSGNHYRDQHQVHNHPEGIQWIDLFVKTISIGKKERWLVRIIDISRQKENESTLNRSDTILRNVENLILVSDHNGDITYVSSSCSRLLGYPEEALLGRGWWDIKRGDKTKTENARRNLARSARGEIPVVNEPYERAVYTKAGEKRWILWKNSRTEDNTIIGVGYDITSERKQRTLREVIFNIAEAAKRAGNLAEFYKFIHREIGRVVKADNFYIALEDKEEGFIYFPYFFREYTDEEPTTTGKIAPQDSLTAYVLRKGMACKYSAKDLKQLELDGKLKNYGPEPSVWIGVPLIYQKAVLGLISIYGFSHQDFDDDDLELLKFISTQIAQLIGKLHAEIALKASEEKYRLISEAAFDGIVIHKNNRILEINQAFAQIFGYSSEEAIGMDINKLIAENSRQYVHNRVTDNYAGTYEFIGRRKDHSTFFVEALGQNHIWNGKEVRIAALRDISERKRAEEAERKAQADAQFKAFVQNSYDIIEILDRQGNLRYISPSVTRILGYEPETLIGKSEFLPVLPDARVQLDSVLQNVLSQPGKLVQTEFYIRHSDGSQRVVESVFNNLLDDPNVRGILVSSRDISDRIAAEQSLQDSEERFKSLFQNSPDAIFVEDRSGRVLDVNQAACDLHRLTREELIGKSVTELVPEKIREQVTNSFGKWFESTQTYHESLSLSTEGKEIPIEIRSSRIYFNGIDAVILQVRDITERKIAEQKLIRSREQLAKQNQTLISLAASPVLNSGNLDLAFEEITQASAKTLGITHASVWLFGKDRKVLDCKKLYSSTSSSFSSGIQLDCEEHKLYVRALEEERTLVTANASEDHRTRNYHPPYLEHNASRSLIDAPIRSGGKVIGVLSFENTGPERTWTNEEQNFAASMADLISLSHQIKERNQAEQKLESSSIALDATFESIKDGILIANQEGKVLHYNNQFISMWGIPREILDSDNPEPGMHIAASRVKEVELFEEKMRVAEKLPDKVGEFEVAFKDGRIIQQYVKSLKLGDKSIGRLWFYHDVTDLKKKEAALQEKEARYRTLFAQAKDAIFVLDHNAISDCNEMTLEVYGASKSEIVGRSLDDYSPEYQPEGVKSADRIREKIQLALAGEPQFFQWRHTRHDKTPFDAEVSLNRIEINHHYYVQAIVRDISERLKQEAALRYSERQNKAILDAVPDMMFRLSVDGIFIGYNLGEQDSFFIPKEKLIGRTTGEVFPSEIATQLAPYLTQALESKNVITFEYKVGEGDEDGSDFEVRLMKSANSELLMIIRDISERKRAERELIKRNFELDSFVYRASHDLKAPLNSLMGLIDLFTRESKDEELKPYLKMMNKSVVKLEFFIRDLTNFSRNARLEVNHTAINFREMIYDSSDNLRFMENADRIQKRVKIDSEIPFYSDPMRIGIIFNNLISNAVKYQNLREEESFVEVQVTSDEGKASISVIDNGIGIPERHQKNIFKLFFRASTQSYGSGLGLYIVKNAVEKLNGKIWFKSEEQKGTSFFIELPNQKPHLNPASGEQAMSSDQ